MYEYVPNFLYMLHTVSVFDFMFYSIRRIKLDPSCTYIYLKNMNQVATMRSII
jgi:hypothetical protein